MCDEDTVRDNEEFLQRQNAMTRRGFGAMAGGSALAFALPAVAARRIYLNPMFLLRHPMARLIAPFIILKGSKARELSSGQISLVFAPPFA